jgi:hypothetical protein
MTVKEIVAKVALELNLPPKYVWEVYKAYWSFIRHSLSELPLKDISSEEEFNKFQTNINIPSLGKFYLDWKRLKNKKEENENFKNKKT